MFPIQRIVPKIKNASIYFNLIIHGPGFGNSFTIWGNKPANIYGADIPIPMKKKMLIISIYDWVNAAETAVPTNGAEQGVAKIVAKKPLKKSLYSELFFFIIKKLFNTGGI